MSRKRYSKRYGGGTEEGTEERTKEGNVHRIVYYVVLFYGGERGFLEILHRSELMEGGGFALVKVVRVLFAREQ